MASYKSTKVLSCVQCSTPFCTYRGSSGKSVVPLTLDCSHSACTSCVIFHVRQRKPIPCPCGKVSVYPASIKEFNVLTRFPVNSYIIGLAQSKNYGKGPREYSEVCFVSNPKKKKSGPMCNECIALNADVNCIQCQAPYCSLCFHSVHSSARALKGHKATQVLDSSDSYLTMCPEHKDQRLEFCCIVCDNKSICSSCLTGSHNGHHISPIEIKNKAYFNQVVESYTRLTNNLARLTASKKTAKQKLQSVGKVKCDVSAQEEVVREHFLKLHGTLILLENRILADLNSSKSLTCLQEVIDKLSAYIEESNLTLHRIRTALGDLSTDGRPIGLCYETVLRDLNAAAEFPSHLILREGNEEKRLYVDEDILETLQNHICVDISNDAAYDLVTEADLPPDYPIDDVPKVCPDFIADLIMSSTNNLSNVSIGSSSDTEDNLSNASYSSSHVSMTDITSVKPAEDLNVGDTVSVTPTHIVSPSEFFVTRVGAILKRAELQRSFKRIVSNGSADIARHPKIDEIYMCMYDDCNWHRCRILSMDSAKTVNVFFIDHGNIGKTNVNSLRNLPVKLRKMPPLALNCKLANCAPILSDWASDAIVLFAQLVQNAETISMTVVMSEEGRHEVHLIIPTATGYINVARALALSGFAQLVDSDLKFIGHKLPSIKQLPDQPEYNIVDFTEHNVMLSNIISPDNFYIAICNNDYKAIVEGQKKGIDDIVRLGPELYDPMPGMTVVVKAPDQNPSSSNAWFRARILKVESRLQIEVFFVDFGSSGITSLAAMRPLPSLYYRYPPLAVNCALADVAPINDVWPPEAHEFLNDYMMKPLRVGNPTYVGSRLIALLLESSQKSDVCLNALMVNLGLAQSTGPYSQITEYPKCLLGDEAPIVLPETHLPINDQNKEQFILKTKDGCIRIKVDMKRIVTPGEFYVTLAVDAEKYQIMALELAEYGENYQSQGEIDWSPSDKCVVPYHDKWYRALILQLNDDMATVTLPDDGRTLNLPLSTVIPLHEKFTEIRDGTTRCHLGGLVPALDKWSLTSNTEFIEFTKKYSSSLYITQLPRSEIKENSLSVELFSRVEIPPSALEPKRDQWISLNHTLRMMGLAKADNCTKWDSNGRIILANSSPVDADAPDDIVCFLLKNSFSNQAPIYSGITTSVSTTLSWLPPDPLPTLSLVAKITHIGDNCEMYLQNILQSTGILKSIRDLANAKCTQLSYDEHDFYYPDEICLAQFNLDNNWYRAVVRKVIEEKYLVEFIDYGNREPVLPSQMRKAVVALQVPRQVHVCHFAQLMPYEECWTARALALIQELVVDRSCNVDLCPIDDNCYGVVNIFMLPDGTSVIDQLVQQKLARLVNPESGTELSVTEMYENAEKSVVFWHNCIKEDDSPMFKLIKTPSVTTKLTVMLGTILGPTHVALIPVKSSDVVFQKVINEYLRIMEAMQKEAMLQPVITPPYIHKVCCAQYTGDGSWYRAIVLSENNEYLNLQFVDYCNCQQVLASEVLSLREDWVKVEAMGLPCRISGVLSRSHDTQVVMQKLNQVLTESVTFEVTVVGKSGSFIEVEIRNSDGEFIYQPLIDQNVYEVC